MDGSRYEQCNVTVGIPTFERADKLVIALNKILACDPKPNEIIVHIDAGDISTEAALKNKFHSIRIIQSKSRVGPGGGRNRIAAEAQNSIIASFDDDSYPLDPDYFQRLITLFEQFPNAAVIGASIFHIGEPISPADQFAAWVSDFVGCGCAYRKDLFQQTQGYVPLTVAYGMEEVDLSLRFHASGWGILQSSWLRVFHNTCLEHHSKPHITAASIANQILLAYLRYPIILWWLGIGQCLSRVLWLIQYKRIPGIISGFIAIPTLIRQYHCYRQVVSAKSLLSYLHLRRNAIAIDRNS